jgi:hypothetical protein
MIFFNLLYFVTLVLSVSTMWHFSEIFQKPRNIVSRIPYIRRPLMCPECSSFWFGFATSFIYDPIVLDFNFFILSNIFCGLVSFFFAHVFLMKKNIDKKMDFIK